MSSIDREDTIEILKDLQKDHLQFCLIPFRQAIERVQALPSADRPQGEVDAVEIYERAELQLERSEITIGKFEEIIEPLRHVFYGRPQEWIPCSERVPSKGVAVLVNGTMYAPPITISADAPYDYEQGWINAWMPLPKPWEGADDESDSES